jgi:hypothetical protein
MAQQIQLKRGLKANIPASAAAGEPILTTDTHELSIGTGSAVTPVKVDWGNVLNQPSIPDVSGYLTGASVIDGGTF